MTHTRRNRPVLIACALLIATVPVGGFAQTGGTCKTYPPGEPRISACRSEFTKNPGDIRAGLLLGAELADAGRYADALDVYEMILDSYPGSFAALYRAGLMLEILGRYGESLEAFRAAERVRPTDQSTHWHLGVAHYNLGRPDEALREFTTAARLGSDDASAWAYMGVCAAALGKHREAVSYWERARREDPAYFEKVQPGERLLYERSLAVAGKTAAATLEGERRRKP